MIIIKVHPIFTKPLTVASAFGSVASFFEPERVQNLVIQYRSKLHFNEMHGCKLRTRDPLPVKVPVKKQFSKIFISPKVVSWHFKGGYLNDF